MTDEYIPPQELNFTNFGYNCIPKQASDLISAEQVDTMRYGSTDLRGLPDEIAAPLMNTASDAHYAYGEYPTKEGGVRNSLFVEENLPGLKFIYETDLGRAKPALLPVTNAYVVLDNGACVNLVEELPRGVEMWYTPSSINGYLHERKIVVLGNQKLTDQENNGFYEPSILTSLHEIGHARDAVINPDAYQRSIPGRAKIATIKVLRNRISSIRENNETYKRAAETDLAGERNASNFARLWTLAMDHFGCNFVPGKIGPERFTSLDRYYATHQVGYYKELLTDQDIRYLLTMYQKDQETPINPRTTKESQPTPQNLIETFISILGLPKK